MKRPLRYRTMGAVREGRGNPSPYSIRSRFFEDSGDLLETFFAGDTGKVVIFIASLGFTGKGRP